MIDNFSLALSHGLLALAAWRLLFRNDLDDDQAPPLPPGGEKAAAWSRLRGKDRPGA